MSMVLLQAPTGASLMPMERRDATDDGVTFDDTQAFPISLSLFLSFCLLYLGLSRTGSDLLATRAVLRIKAFVTTSSHVPSPFLFP